MSPVLVFSRKHREGFFRAKPFREVHRIKYTESSAQCEVHRVTCIVVQIHRVHRAKYTIHRVKYIEYRVKYIEP